MADKAQFVQNMSFDDAEYLVFRLEGVREPESLARLLDMLKHRILVDLSPSLDECYSLGPYTVFDGANRETHYWGNLLHRSKYLGDKSAGEVLLNHIEGFIETHLPIRTVDTVIAAPKTDRRTPDMPGTWVEFLAERRGWTRAQAFKAPTSGAQKSIQSNQEELELVERMKNTITISDVSPNSRVLIVDDTIRSGGTLIEIARELRANGVSEVYGVTVAKDARMTYGGVDLNKEAW
ncbi:MAG: phosphoribosyltransferase family protein [Chloroflexota bacterium]|nr:phosphoribosyltransferase family protein [Chloroflexota bacterium]